MLKNTHKTIIELCSTNCDNDNKYFENDKN